MSIIRKTNGILPYIRLIKQNKNKAKENQKGKKGNILISTGLLFIFK